jgi:hypothetical protein
MPLIVLVPVILIVVLVVALVVENHMWHGRFCGCCLHRKDECICVHRGGTCHWCRAKDA